MHTDCQQVRRTKTSIFIAGLTHSHGRRSALFKTAGVKTLVSFPKPPAHRRHTGKGKRKTRILLFVWCRKSLSSDEHCLQGSLQT